MLKKRAIAAIGVVVILLAFLAGGTYAYVTRSAVTRNVITTGSIRIALVETGLTGTVSEPIPMLPGFTAEKTFAVRNVEATQSAYIRVRVDVDIRDIVNWPVSVTPEELATILALPHESGWVEKDGWLYYKEALRPGQTTDEALSAITFTAQMPNKFQNCTAAVTLTAQAVQVKNNGATVFEALGWPES